jgi:hypothetical protein
MPGLDDPVWGCKAIGAEVGRTAEQANHLCRVGALPVVKVGRAYVSTPRRLRAAVGLDVRQPDDAR